MAMTPIRPRALHPGDLIGICAPSGPVDRERLTRGVKELESLGFAVRADAGLTAHERYTAGSPQRRLQELHGLFADPSVAGIVCARGGAGAIDLLARLDTDLLRANPKVFVGYSDITLLHLALGRLGLVSFHGPMAARDLGGEEYDRDSFCAATMGEGPLSSWAGLRTLREGAVEGRLRGGCLSLLAATCGTRFGLPVVPDEDVVLLLEDVDEAPYRIDRMLWQLRHAGAFAGVRGIVFGMLRGCAPAATTGYSLEQILRSALAGLELAVATGLRFGHTDQPSLTLPLGVRARLDCGAAASLTLLEEAVA